MHAVQMLSASRRKARAVTRHGQIIIRDRRRTPGDQVAQKLPGPAGHGPAQRTVPGVQPQVFVRRTANHRRTIRRHRPQAGPEGSLLNVAAAREQIANHHLQRSRRGFSNSLLKPTISAIPPTRIRLSKRVIAIL